MANKDISKSNTVNKVRKKKPKPQLVNVKVTGAVKTQETKRLFLQAFLKNACNIYVACQKTDISRSAYYKWVKSDRVFAKAIADCRESLIDLVEGRMYEKILTTDPADADSQLIKFHLERKAKHRGYGDKTETAIDIKITHKYIKPKEINNGS